ncbi:MAG: T9SS type A sorting domain-containing protein, partial [Gemmatimonadetes bacterium]|nr:T9SS type A sorting domain-containing protein [Gemmatimonadota bacterium]
GDEIMVILRPAPGAVPDPDTGDDFRVATFAGTPIAWDHRIDGVELTPSSAGTGLWDITIDGLVQFREMNAFADPRTGTVPLGFELELVVSGVSRSTQWIPFDPVPTGACGCGETCGSHNGFPLVCLLGHGGWCSCSWSWLTTIPGEPLSPGDEIMVILRPAPGALPELPGFQDEDEQRADCCPGVTGVAARVPTATRRLRANQPNPFADATTIEYVAGSDSRVTLEVFDVRGRRVTTLVDGTDRKADEIRRVVWSGHSDGGGQVPPGTYFLRLTSDGRSETRKMTVTR